MFRLVRRAFPVKGNAAFYGSRGLACQWFEGFSIDRLAPVNQ
jgi:hypothetical protein